MSRVTPHAVPLSGVRTTADGRRLMLLIMEPRPFARAAGEVAYKSGLERWANPHAEETAEYVNWDTGWNDARQRNS